MKRSRLRRVGLVLILAGVAAVHVDRPASDVVRGARQVASLAAHVPEPPSPAPKLLDPADHSTHTGVAGEELWIKFRWTGVPPATDVWFTLSKGRDHRVLRRTNVTTQDELDVSFLSQGTYHWSIETAGRVTEASFEIRRRASVVDAPAAPLLAAEAEVPVGHAADPAPSPKPSFWITLGGGLGAAQVEQTMTTRAQADFTSPTGSSWSIRGGFARGRVGAEVSLRQARTPVPPRGSAVAARAFAWRSMSAEGRYVVRGEGTGLRLGVRAGVHEHRLPYVSVGGQRLRVEHFDLATGSLGVDLTWLSAHRVRYQAVLRYQLPLGQRDVGESNFRAVAPAVIDGALGGEYLLTEHVTLGLSYSPSLYRGRYRLRHAGGAADGGRHDLMLHSFELLLGYHF